jgi:hypothetical protein
MRGNHVLGLAHRRGAFQMIRQDCRQQLDEQRRVPDVFLSHRARVPMAALVVDELLRVAAHAERRPSHPSLCGTGGGCIKARGIFRGRGRVRGREIDY